MLFYRYLIQPYTRCIGLIFLGLSIACVPLQLVQAAKNTSHLAKPKTVNFALAASEGVTTRSDVRTLYLMGLKSMTGHEGAKKDYGLARQFFEEAAKYGYTKAELMAGTLYYDGLGGEKDYSKARRYFEKAAASNQPSAQFQLGVMEQLGKGTPKNHAAAAEWYEKSASQGHVRANVALAMLYASGTGVQQNFKKAYDYYMFAALRGNNVAQLKLGLMYKFGLGTAIDVPRSQAWIEIAAANGSEKAQGHLKSPDTAALSPAERAKASQIKQELEASIQTLRAEKPVL